MTLPYDKKLAASRPTQIQSTGSNPSLLLIHIILPSDFSAGYYVNWCCFCFSVVENKYTDSVAVVVVAVEPVAKTVAAAWDFVLFLSVV